MALSSIRQEHLYLCVQEMNKEGYAITEICGILDLNRSSYYNWTNRAKSNREIENETLLHYIGLIYAEHNGTYGYRRIADDFIVVIRPIQSHESVVELQKFCFVSDFHRFPPSPLPALGTQGENG